MKRDSSWVAYNDSSSWGISLTHAFFPQLCDVENATEIEEYEEGDITIYPNPTNGNVTVRIEKAENPTIKVYDYAGKLVRAEQSVNGNETTIHLSHCATGMYLIVINNGNQNITKKISLIK